MKIPAKHDELSYKEKKDVAYWERNVLALYFATYVNGAWQKYVDYCKVTGVKVDETPPCGWYYDPDNDWDGWRRVISLLHGKICYHVRDDFDLGNLPQIEPNWDGHTTQEKYARMLKFCGVPVESDEQSENQSEEI